MPPFRTLLLLLWIHLPFAWAQAQFGKERMNWYFGNSAGITFQTNPPSALTDGQMTTAEGCAVANDRQGQLLFYSNGVNIWNRDHLLMKNGSGLSGNISTTQSATIVRQPGSNDKYYVFTLDNISGTKGFCYSIVDMQGDSGRGEVITKNVKLYGDNGGEKQAVVPHKNNKDFWIMMMEKPSVNTHFRAYLLTDKGLDTSFYVRSSNGGLIMFQSDGVGYLSFSFDGRQMAVACTNILKAVVLYDFDASNGTLTPRFSLAMQGSPYGVIFSPNSRYLYVNVVRNITYDPVVKQFDLGLGDSAQVAAGEKQISTRVKFGALQYGLNGKLYIGSYTSRHLSTIPFPDLAWPACGFIDTAVNLAGRNTQWGLPAFLIENKGIQATGSCYGDSSDFTFWPLTADSVHWHFGDSLSGTANFSRQFEPKHLFSDTGIYQVRLIRWDSNATDTFWSEVKILKYPVFHLGNDTSICRGDTIKIDTRLSLMYQFAWNTGAKTTAIKADTAGLYKVSVSNGCISTDSINIIIKEKPLFSLGSDTSICSGDSLLLSTGLDSSYTFSWSNGSTLPAQRVGPPGIFHVWVQKAGCSSSDTVALALRTKPVFSLGADTSICDGDSLKLDPGLGTTYSYQWSSSDTSQYYWVSEKGLYWLQVSDGFCNSTDSMNLDVLSRPLIYLPADTFLCTNDSLRVQLFSSGNYTYQWSTGATTPAIHIDTTGVYGIKVEQGKCWSEDSSRVNIYPAATALELGADIHLCSGVDILLKATAGQAAQYTWQDGSGDSVLQVIHPGFYSVKRQTACSTEADSIMIEACPCKLRVPNVFTPDGDGFNDVFKADSCEPQSFNMLIYNRWGQLLFESHDIRQGWDGRSKSGDAPEGTYYWQVRYTLSPKQEVKLIGNLMLIR